MMTFKQYSVMYLEMFSRLPAKQKAIMAGVLILAAGSGGLPFAEDIEDIIDTIGQWLGYRTNARRTIRRGLSDMVGQQAADVAMNGVLSQLGIDLHSRLGLQNLIPGTALIKPSTTDKGREFQDLLGPAASVVAAMGQALQDLATGHPDRAAMEMAPTAFRNLAQGAKMAAKGIQRTPRGARACRSARRSQWPRWSGSIQARGRLRRRQARSGAGPAAGHGQAGGVFFRDRGRHSGQRSRGAGGGGARDARVERKES